MLVKKGAPDPLPEELYLRCVHCGMCVRTCPLFQETGLEMDSPRGRVQLLRGFSLGELAATPGLFRTIWNCLDCRACEAACPSGVRPGALVEKARDRLGRLEKRPGAGILLRELAMRFLFPYPRRLELAGRFLRFYQRSGLRTAARRLGLLKLFPPAVREMERILPAVPARTARAILARADKNGEGGARAGNGRTAGLFLGCVMDVLFAGINLATARLLERHGFRVTAPAGQVCCGALHLHNGNRAGAVKLARRNIDAFLAAGVDCVVTNAGGCGAALLEYPEILAGDPVYADRAREFARKVIDIAELLAQTGFVPPRGSFPHRVAYQASCHLKNIMGVADAPKRLLRQVSGLTLLEMPDEARCCGGAGIYNLTHPEMAGALLRRKMADIPPGTEVVATGNPGCLLQLLHGAEKYGPPVQVKHIVEILEEAYTAGEHK
ncbi:(Fe-S)-binding protein [Desulfofundulus thermobenzoicus]|nr:(Fe-S)-binding protein [Desulfofundulus thermobenzoicus]